MQGTIYILGTESKKIKVMLFHELAKRRKERQTIRLFDFRWMNKATNRQDDHTVKSSN